MIILIIILSLLSYQWNYDLINYEITNHFIMNFHIIAWDAEVFEYDDLSRYDWILEVEWGNDEDINDSE
jgi:hypothetical protein